MSRESGAAPVTKRRSAAIISATPAHAQGFRPIFQRSAAGNPSHGILPRSHARDSRRNRYIDRMSTSFTDQQWDARAVAAAGTCVNQHCSHDTQPNTAVRPFGNRTADLSVKSCVPTE